jgi:Tfp pilus assembly protein PilN
MMETQNDLYWRQARREVFREVAIGLVVMAVGCGVLVGVVLGLSGYVVRTPIEVNVHIVGAER